MPRPPPRAALRLPGCALLASACDSTSRTVKLLPVGERLVPEETSLVRRWDGNLGSGVDGQLSPPGVPVEASLTLDRVTPDHAAGCCVYLHEDGGTLTCTFDVPDRVYDDGLGVAVVMTMTTTEKKPGRPRGLQVVVGLGQDAAGHPGAHVRGRPAAVPEPLHGEAAPGVVRCGPGGPPAPARVSIRIPFWRQS